MAHQIFSLAVTSRPVNPASAALALALALLLAPGAGDAEPANYVIDPEHVTVGFKVHHLGYADVVGLFRVVEGSYSFDEATGELVDVEVTVATDSVFSNHEARDEHVRGRDFLNSSRFPAMRFTAAGAERIDERRFAITGELELLGLTRPLRLDATWNKSGPYPIGGGAWVMGVSATGTLQRADYGMDYALDNGWVGGDVEIFVEFEARRE